jgi:conjugal transfer pilus assembly protein TrbC
LLLCGSEPAPAQQLEATMRHPWTLYVFVSTGMPHAALVNLAREAGLAHASMVLRGFPGSTFDLGAGQRLVTQLNEECCGVSARSAQSQSVTGAAAPTAAQQSPGWSIDPALYRRFDVSVVPTFVLAATGGTGDDTFTKVSGDMALASALKYVAQGSSSAARRAAAASIYQSAYGGRQ